MNNTVQRLLALAAAMALAGNATAAHDHNSHAFSAFLSAEADFASTTTGGRDEEIDAVADVIFSHQAGRWRLLGELVLSPDEHEMERVQLGYEVADNTIIWLGRFHQPSSVWNVFYHHGQFLQTSITRPAMEEWEDEHGFLPQHIVGGMVESFIPTAGADAWRISVSTGLAPRIEPLELEPFVPFQKEGADFTHASARLEWLPDALGEDVIGLVASTTRMRRDGSLTASPVTLRTAGLFANLGTDRVRALGNVMLLHTKGSTQAGLEFRNHVSAYLQLEAEARSDITLFARQELLTNVRNSAYLAELTRPPARRTVVGARAQFGLRNALSVELSRSRFPGSTRRDLRLQWSAAFP